MQHWRDSSPEAHLCKTCGYKNLLGNANLHQGEKRSQVQVVSSKFKSRIRFPFSIFIVIFEDSLNQF